MSVRPHLCLYLPVETAEGGRGAEEGRAAAVNDGSGGHDVCLEMV